MFCVDSHQYYTHQTQSFNLIFKNGIMQTILEVGICIYHTQKARKRVYFITNLNTIKALRHYIAEYKQDQDKHQVDWLDCSG